MQLAATLPSRLRRLGRAVVDGVLPPRCLACGATVGEVDSLCGPCWGAISFFAPPWCSRCGLPFAHPMGEGAVCADCARQQPSWDRARAVLRYDRHSRRLVLMLKHGDQTHLAGAFGRWMHRAGGEVLAGADLLMPVPLHWTRLFGRRFNQAALLARAIHRAGGRPSRRIGWRAAAARRRRGCWARRHGRAMCAGPSRCAAGAASRASGWC
ncbi:MAG TPA: double zinc ribbon domain-containing protein [Stellaceae bacterium]|nr:double zinc ribbon domain-containing protein [Stellaceae bacterium]